MGIFDFLFGDSVNKLVKTSRKLTPFKSLSGFNDLPSQKDWITYRSEKYDFSFSYPPDWSIYMEDVAVEATPTPWIEAIVLIAGTPPDAYLGFHVSLRQAGVLEGLWKRPDGSEAHVADVKEIPSIRREHILASFHSPIILDEQNVKLAGLRGNLLSYQHFGLKKATERLDSPLLEHSCLLYGDGVTYEIIIEYSESVVEKYHLPLLLIINQLELQND